MSLNSDRVDAYLASKGLAPILSDVDWDVIIQRVVELYGREVCHRSRRITQAHDTFRRVSRVFPDGLAIPRRHIPYAELFLAESLLLDDLDAWLEARGCITERVTDDAWDQGVLLYRVFGFNLPADAVA